MFAVHRVTVARWAEDGLLRGFKTPGGQWRFRRVDVDAFRDGELAPNEPPAVSGGAS